MREWNSEQYLKFADERTRPARDLLAQVPLAESRRVFDLGCGPGNSTELLAARYPNAEITGIDSSPDMLEAARDRLPELSFVQADVAAWTPDGECDLLFANAVFQWVPHHPRVLQRLAAHLKPGGVLAVQMPDNLGEPVHALMCETAAQGPWASGMADAARDELPAAQDYYDLLRSAASHVDIWRTTYHHPLEGAQGIVEWMKGTGLRPFLAKLAPDEQRAFLESYTARIAAAYPLRADGKVLLAFPRLFIIAVR
ncbi:MAG: trans-aconitate 2-methyltransferase [Hyphomicrobiales bacterium]